MDEPLAFESSRLTKWWWVYAPLQADGHREPAPVTLPVCVFGAALLPAQCGAAVPPSLLCRRPPLVAARQVAPARVQRAPALHRSQVIYCHIPLELISTTFAAFDAIISGGPRCSIVCMCMQQRQCLCGPPRIPGPCLANGYMPACLDSTGLLLLLE